MIENSILALLLALFMGIIGFRLSIENQDIRGLWIANALQDSESKSAHQSTQLSRQQETNSSSITSFIIESCYEIWQEVATATADTLEHLSLKLKLEKQPAQLVSKKNSKSGTPSGTRHILLHLLLESLSLHQRHSAPRPNNYIRKGMYILK